MSFTLPLIQPGVSSGIVPEITKQPFLHVSYPPKAIASTSFVVSFPTWCELEVLRQQASAEQLETIDKQLLVA